MAVNLSSCILRVHTLILLASLFIHFVVFNFCQLNEQGKVDIVSLFHFLVIDTREQKKYEMRTQASVDNTVNDLHYEIKFENCIKDKNNFLVRETLLFLLEQKFILFLETYFLKIPQNLITSAFFCRGRY